jgi:gluconokinase
VALGAVAVLRDLGAHMSVYTGQAVVMGVSGCGKSTVGRALAARLHAQFLEGDELHPPHNIERMAAGVPLTDDDRRDWLRALAQRIGAAHGAHSPLIVSCSALKRSYRDLLRSGGSPALAFVYLHGEHALFAARMSQRTGHYMPATLLDSQLATLEAPGADERALTLDAALPPEQLAARAAAWLSVSSDAA